jgi:hypothetical protein
MMKVIGLSFNIYRSAQRLVGSTVQTTIIMIRTVKHYIDGDTKKFKLLVNTQSQADDLITRLDKANIAASHTKSPNGKYIVKFEIKLNQ